MCDTTAIIIAGGEASRWKDYLGSPKHLIKINEEPILYRTVRLLKYNNITNIYIVSKDDARYKVEGTTQFIPDFNYKDNADADKFLNSKSLWNEKGRTIVLYGDVFFTEEAMKTICNYTVKDWTLFCRPNGSRFTGGIHGECFVQSFYTNHIEKHHNMLTKIAALKNQNKIKRCGGWEHYRAYVGSSDLDRHEMRTNYYVIDDFTDDFDLPEDYDRFISRYNVV